MRSNHHVTEEHYLVTYDVNSTGVRLDHFLKERYRKRSREQIKRAIESGAITLERNQGRHLVVGKLKPSSQLIAGDRVLVLSDRKPEPEVSFDYKVLYEDDLLLVVDKPPNLPVHPAGRYFFNTLLVHLKTRGHQNPLRSEHEYFLAHRIDKETSGILVMTKTSESCAEIVRQFATRTTRKKYLAIARGITPESFKIDAPLRRSHTSKISLKMETAAPGEDGAQEAMTEFRRLETRGGYSLVECFPKTGRQHQIRVHLEAAGHPILGDKLYGMPEVEALRFYERENLSPEAWTALVLPRHALHAAELEIEHPRTGERMVIRSELPQDLRGFLDSLPA